MGLTGHGRAARGPVWKARPRRLQLDTREAILNQGGLQGTEAVHAGALCREGYWWVAVPTGTSWEAKQLGQMLSVPIVLCRAEPDAPKSEEIWTQRFSADGRVRNNHPVQGKGETMEGLWG